MPRPDRSDVLATAARLTFAAVLAPYFLASALTKIDLASPLGLSAGAYAQIVPIRMEAVGYDPAALTADAHLVVAAGTLAEGLLPLCLVVGLMTRAAALGMIVVLVVMSVVDITGHGVDATALGALFDRTPDSPILDQRILWANLLLVLAVLGGGRLSLDRWIRHRLGARRRPAAAAQAAESP